MHWYTGWAYLLSGLIVMDTLLVVLWLMDKDWPKYWWKKR